MARFSGKAGSVAFDSGAVLGVTTWDADFKAETTEVTGMDSVGAKEFLAGLTECAGSFSGNWEGTGAPPMAGQSATILLKSQPSGGISVTGSAIITGVKPSVDVKGVVTFDCQFQATAAVSLS